MNCKFGFFNGVEKIPFNTILVHFKNQQSIEIFSKLIGQRITDNTKSIWYPRIEIKEKKKK